MTTTINGIATEATEFAWDECHKIYIIETEEDKKKFLSYGYELFPIKQLKKAWSSSCGLRFISRADLEGNFIGQFEGRATIKVLGEK